MFLISRIGLFSLALFVILISIGIYMAATVSLDIELALDGISGPNEEIFLYTEESRAVVIEPGDKAKVTLGNGTLIEAEVTDVIRKSKDKTERSRVVLKPLHPLSESVDEYLFANVGAPLSATIFTQHSLWTFLKEKVDY